MSSKVKSIPENTAANTQPKPMTKAEMIQKMLADQKFIREAIQKGVSFQELRDRYGFVFKTV